MDPQDVVAALEELQEVLEEALEQIEDALDDLDEGDEGFERPRAACGNPTFVIATNAPPNTSEGVSRKIGHASMHAVLFADQIPDVRPQSTQRVRQLRPGDVILWQQVALAPVLLSVHARRQ